MHCVGTLRTSGFLTRFTCLLNVVEQHTALSMRHQILNCQRCFRTNQTCKPGFRPLRVVEQRRRKSVPKARKAVKRSEALEKSVATRLEACCERNMSRCHKSLTCNNLEMAEALLPHLGSRAATFFGDAAVERSRSARYCSESLSARVRISMAACPVAERDSNTATSPSAPSSNISAR